MCLSAFVPAQSGIPDPPQKLKRQGNLYDLIGKDEFRNFALGLIEKHLLTLANIELKHLCDGRYELIHQKRKETLYHDFYIVDYNHQGMERKISTLSGGETFLVSLALALSLSEMTRGKTQIDSFFIDEGFGSLDPDYMEDVTEALFNLRGQGKTIGIISHIPTLTSRLPVNIVLKKSALGHSSLQVQYT